MPLRTRLSADGDGKPNGVPPDKQDTKEDAVDKAAKAVATELDADVLFYNGDIGHSVARSLAKACRTRRHRKNIMLILVTNGGDPDAAYRMARHLQAKYERFILFVTGVCKSAGTLLALGAHELVFGDEGELGPLDIQMSKSDTLWDAQSGLTVNAALTALQDKAYLAFEQFFLETERKSMGRITVKTAGDIAAKLATGLFAPLYSQIDPIHVGEAARAMQIGDDYGRRLVAESGNLDPTQLQHFVTHFPSHGFVIDRDEAEHTFENVRPPSAAEEALLTLLGPIALDPVQGDEVILAWLSPEVEQESSEEKSPELAPDDKPVAAPSNNGLADVSQPETAHA